MKGGAGLYLQTVQSTKDYTRGHVSPTWQWSTSAGERNETKAGTDPLGFPVSCYTLGM